MAGAALAYIYETLAWCQNDGIPYCTRHYDSSDAYIDHHLPGSKSVEVGEKGEHVSALPRHFCIQMIETNYSNRISCYQYNNDRTTHQLIALLTTWSRSCGRISDD